MTVTVFGVGAVRGAVNAAESAIAVPPANCVVTTVRTPQEFPLQPGPLRDQDRTALGLELGTGVNVATMVAVPLVTTEEGADNCNEKLLVMATTVEACLEGSATLCALSVTLAGEGRIRGAV